MIITIAGDLGSGKSTVGKLLASKLGYKHYSTGDFMRQMASERGVSLLELSRMAESDYSIDRALDARQTEFGKKQVDFVLDSRLGWHFIPKSFKVYLKVDPREAARRIMKRMSVDSIHKSSETENTGVKKAFENMRTRRDSENRRYDALYGLDQSDIRNYDLVVDTSEIPAEEVARILHEAVKGRLKS